MKRDIFGTGVPRHRDGPGVGWGGCAGGGRLGDSDGQCRRAPLSLGTSPPSPPPFPATHPKRAIPRATAGRSRAPSRAGDRRLRELLPSSAASPHTNTHTGLRGSGSRRKTSGGKKHEQRQRRQETELSTEDVGGMGDARGERRMYFEDSGLCIGPRGLKRSPHRRCLLLSSPISAAVHLG